VEIYSPLIHRWLSGYGISATEAEDMSQDVFHTLLLEMRNFAHNGHKGAFRRWLKLIIMNRLKGLWRARKTQALTGYQDAELILSQMEDPASDPNVAFDRDHDIHVIGSLLKVVEPQFTVSTWRAFYLQVMESQKAREVAQQLGITANAALIAKSRVMRALRLEAEGLIEFE
jgi:RNA polymerase sigma-70 factor, ECF subfamily